MEEEILRAFYQECVGDLEKFKNINLVTDLKKISKTKFNCNLSSVTMQHFRINISFKYSEKKVTNIYVNENHFFMHFGEFISGKTKFGNMQCIKTLEFDNKRR